jgi:hypothetical protein
MMRYCGSMCTMIVEQAHTCAAHGDRISIVLRDRDLSSPDDRNYRYKIC